MTSTSEPFLQEQQVSHIVTALKTCARGAAVTAALIGCLGLLGRAFEIPAIRGVWSGLRTIEPNAALAFALSGAVLWMRSNEQTSTRTRRFADAGAFAVLLVALFTLLEYVFRRNLGIDQFLFYRASEPSVSLYPGRMAPAAALLFLLLALGLIFLDAEDRRGRRPAQFLLVVVGLFSLAVLLGYLFTAIVPKKDVPYTSSLLWAEALAFLLLALGALCAWPGKGMARQVAADAVGGDVARRLLPAAVLVPPLLCVLCYLGYAIRWYEVGFGLALLTTLNSAVFTVLIWRTAGALNKTDLQRQSSEMQKNQLTEALQQAHAFREKVMDSAVFAFIALDLEGRFTLVNRRLAEITGYSMDDLIGQPCANLLPPGDRDLVERLQDALQGGTAVYTTEKQLICKDGSSVNIACSWSALFSEGRIIGFVGTGEDITERKRLEEQLFQARKLESIGRLAGGVAHDFNNLLTAIFGYAELLEGELPAEGELTDYVHHIQQASERAAGLTSQLLAFARRQVIEPKVIVLNDLVLNLKTMLQRLIGEHIQLVVQPSSERNAVCIDPNQFEQILINLVVNARDAISLEGGRIVVETGHATLDAEYASRHEGVTPGEYVMLAVSDTGIGMEEGIRLHIFEPFFTTKEKGRGTGLGLATVYGIVKQAGGHIWLYSEVGKGTTFKIYLPRASEPAEEAGAPVSSAMPLRGTETVLVVEDEMAVRALATSALRGLGYRVLEAADGVEALKLAETHTEEIALLITDVIMPKMSGKELADRLASAHPALKVLFVSGYTENTIVHHGVLDPGIAFLSKPFTLSALSLKVREILNSP